MTDINVRIAAYHDAKRRIQAKHPQRRGVTYDPVVPALHAWREWRDDPTRWDPPPKPSADACGTCGLPPQLHEGWREREAVATRYEGYDRYDLLLVIAALEARHGAA